MRKDIKIDFKGRVFYLHLEVEKKADPDQVETIRKIALDCMEEAYVFGQEDASLNSSLCGPPLEESDFFMA